MKKPNKKNVPNKNSNEIIYNLKHNFIEKCVNPDYYLNNDTKKILTNYIISNSYYGSTLGVFGKWGSGKSSLLKAVEMNINKNNKNNKNDKQLIWIKVWNIIDNNDSEHTSIRNKIIKEMYIQLIKEKDLKNLDYANEISFSKSNKRKLKFIKLMTISFMLIIVGTLFTAFMLYLKKVITLEFFQTLMPSTLLTAGITVISTIYFNIKGAIPHAKYKQLENNYFYERALKEILAKNSLNKNSDIIFIFDDLDQLDNAQVFEVLKNIKVFLNHKKIKSIFLLDEQQILNQYKKANIKQLDNQKSIDSNSNNIVSKYFNYSIRLKKPGFIELERCFQDNYSKVELLVNQNFSKSIKNVKEIISDFILWNNDFSYSDIIDLLNNFIVNCNEINYQTNKSDLLNLLLLSVLQICFAELQEELLKDIDGQIFNKIKKYCASNSNSLLSDFFKIFTLNDDEFQKYLLINDINIEVFKNLQFFKFINKFKKYILQLETSYDFLYKTISTKL